MHPTHRAFIIGGIVLVAIGLSVGTWYWLSVHSRMPDTAPIVAPNEQDATTDEASQTTTTTFPTPAASAIPEVRLPSGLAPAITWTKPQPVNRLGLLKKTGDFNYEDQSTYQQVGTFTYNGQNGRVILLTIPFDGPGPSTHLRLVEWQGNMVVLTKYSDTAYSVTGELTENFSDPSSAASFWDPAALSRLSVSSLAIPLLDFADSLVVKNTITLTKKTGLNPFFGPTLEVNTNDTVLITDAVHGPLYTSTSTGAFYFVTPDGFPVIYSLKPDFVGENDNIPQVTWKNGEKNTETYAYTTRGGCGSIDFISVVTTVSVVKDLVATGTTVKGAFVYEFKDPNNAYLKDYYDNTYAPGRDGEKITYAEFVKQHPIFFWVDPFGRLIRFTNDLLGTAAECGKPVIYLYPKEKTHVRVEVKPEGGLTYSDPVYGQGWEVFADPSGELTEVSSGKTYPYLFWEGRGGLYQTPKKGFVVAQKDVESFLKEKLAVLGLNSKETADFMEFWVPRMQGKPYYFVAFLGTRQMNALAPLTISPQPETVVRILMDFTPLDAPISVEPENLGTTPERTGFTVIEWGGVLR